MTPNAKSRRVENFSPILCVALMIALGPTGWAQEVSPALLQAARASYQQEQQAEPELLAAAKVDPKLVGKKVEVHYRDGRTVKGKLVELGPDFLRLESHGQIEEIPFSEVSSVSQRKGTARKAWIIVGVSAAAVGVLLLLTARYWEE